MGELYSRRQMIARPNVAIPYALDRSIRSDAIGTTSGDLGPLHQVASDGAISLNIELKPERGVRGFSNVFYHYCVTSLWNARQIELWRHRLSQPVTGLKGLPGLVGRALDPYFVTQQYYTNLHLVLWPKSPYNGTRYSSQPAEAA